MKNRFIQTSFCYLITGILTWVFSLFLIGGILTTTSCAEDRSEIPSFVRIDSIAVDSSSYDSVGKHTGKIDFAFVYVDDNLQGVYQLPCKFPVIGEGPKNFKIYAGVYEFGNGAATIRYSFYQPYEVFDTLVKEETLILAPHVIYDPELFIPSIQDFDSPGFGSDFVKSGGTTGDYFSNYAGGNPGSCGYLYMQAGDTTYLQIETVTAINVPKNLQLGCFLELDYKCNAPFYLDIKTSVEGRSIVGFNTKTTWSKIYINLSYAVNSIQGTDIKLIFRTPRVPGITDQEIFIDNVKLIYKV